MALVVLDTSVVMILAGERSAEHRAKERAEDLVAHHQSKHDPIAIPAAVLAECCHCDEEIWGRLMVLNLNAAAAILANKLTPAIRLTAGKKERRQCLKMDALILATAEQQGASILYTVDGWFEKAAKDQGLRVTVKGLPPAVPKQTRLTDLDGSS